MSNDWVVEAVIQFIKSPLWTAPVNNFIDDECRIFTDDGGEMKHEYTTTFQGFQNLIDSLLTTFIEELGVPAEEVIAACKSRLELERGSKRGNYVTEFVEYVTYLDDFRSFKKFMEARNVALDLEAARELQKIAAARKAGADTGVSPKITAAVEGSVETDEERDLRLAIEASLAEAEVAKGEAHLEDADLQKALALSIALEEERLIAQQQYLEECTKRAAEREEERRRIEVEKARLEEEHVARVRALEEATLQQRKENIIAHQVATAPPQDDEFTQPAVPATTHQPPAVQPTPVSPQVEDVVRVTALPPPVQPSALAPLGKKTFSSFKALPSIPSIQPTFTQLSNTVAAEVSSAPIKATASAAPAQVFVNKSDAPQTEIEERARQMRALRERIAATKKAERTTELENFKTTNASPATEQAATADDATRRFTVEIARRFREDLIGESRK